MKPNFYVDLFFMGGAKSLQRRASSAMKVLHGIFSENKGLFAVAFPGKNEFSVIRIFAENVAELNLIADTMEVDMAGLGIGAGRIKAVPADFAGEWRSYRRYRIPTLKADRTKSGALREKRIKEADNMNMLRFLVESASNGNRFSLFVDVQQNGSECKECHPDSYGLSVSTRQFALPHFPSVYG